MALTVVGLDIGEHSLRAVEVANASTDRATIIRFAEVPHSGIARAGEVVDASGLTMALKKLWKSEKFSSKNVMLGVGSARVFARDVELPRMTPRQLKQSLQYHVQDILPMPAAEAVMDFVPLGESESTSGPVVTGLLVVAPKASVLTLVNAVRDAGLSPLGVDLVAFALARVQQRAMTGRGLVAFVDIGAGSTNVVIAADGVPDFVRLVPLGGDDITRALARRLESTEVSAEKIKRDMGFRPVPVGGTVDQKAAAETINKITGELLTDIRTTLQYYISNNPGKQLAGIILSGGGSRMDGLSVGLREYTQLDVSFIDASSTLNKKRGIRDSQPQDLDSMTVALGLALGAQK
ncbi:MAG: type IV pilus assembly protein PilM [Microbacteriaceae bacterium]